MCTLNIPEGISSHERKVRSQGWSSGRWSRRGDSRVRAATGGGGGGGGEERHLGIGAQPAPTVQLHLAQLGMTPCDRPRQRSISDSLVYTVALSFLPYVFLYKGF